jgi:hypothetical protein
MITDTRALREAISRAVARLVSVREFGETSVVSVPVSYPSGSFAAVHISVSGDKCFVSDCALGFREAEMAGASDFFDSSAKDAADWFGVGYDGASVFAASASLDRIEGAIVAVANASASAVARALLRAAESKERRANVDIYERVREIFGTLNVTKQASIDGRDASWEAHNIVTVGRSRAIFEFVGNHGNSIANKYMMFSDISRSENAPALVSIVSSIEKMPRKALMLNEVSSIVEVTASSDDFERYTKSGSTN